MCVFEVDIDVGKYMFECEDYLFVDCCLWKEYDCLYIIKSSVKIINVLFV